MRYPEGSKFFDVDGAAIARLPDGTCVFPSGKPFPNLAKVFSYGTPISREEFESLAAGKAAP